MIEFALLCGLTGHVFIHILCQPGEIFGWWPPLLRWWLFRSTAVRDFEEMEWWQLALYKPLAGCGVCCSGWVAVVFWQQNGEHDFFTFVFFVSSAIFTAWLLEKLRDKII